MTIVGNNLSYNYDNITLLPNPAGKITKTSPCIISAKTFCCSEFSELNPSILNASSQALPQLHLDMPTHLPFSLTFISANKFLTI